MKKYICYHLLSSTSVCRGVGRGKWKHFCPQWENDILIERKIKKRKKLLNLLYLYLSTAPCWSSVNALFVLQPSCTSVSDTAAVTTLLSDTKTLRQILEEAASLLRRFCTTNLPKGTGTKEVRIQDWTQIHVSNMFTVVVFVLSYFHHYICLQEDSLKEELSSLRLKLSEQEQVLKDTVERLQSSNRTKDSMEHFIISQRESASLPLLASLCRCCWITPVTTF